jgi:HSP20 family protein
MALMRWDPFTALARLDDEFDEVVRRTFGASSYQFVPPVEMSVENGDVVIAMEVPGVDVGDIDLEVANGRLTVSGERKDRREESRGKILVRELRYGSFRRTFQLPPGVTPDQIEADVDKGMLRIRIKNVTRQVAPQKISVHGAESPQQPTIESRTTEAEQAETTATDTGTTSATDTGSGTMSASGSGGTRFAEMQSGSAATSDPAMQAEERRDTT